MLNYKVCGSRWMRQQPVGLAEGRSDFFSDDSSMCSGFVPVCVNFVKHYDKFITAKSSYRIEVPYTIP